MVTMSIKATPLTAEDCREWPSMAYWSYKEAIFLSMGLSPNHRSHEIGEDEAEKLGIEFLSRVDKIERSVHAAEEMDKFPRMSIPSQEERLEVLEARGEREENVCRPALFTIWAMRNFPSFPEELYEAVKDRYPTQFLPIQVPAEGTPQKATTALRNSQRAKERCQAIAELLWDQDESIKIMDMVEKEEIKKYGQGGCYEPSTIYDWVTEVAPKNRNKPKRS